MDVFSACDEASGEGGNMTKQERERRQPRKEPLASDEVPDTRRVATRPGQGQHAGLADAQPRTQVFHTDDKRFFNGRFSLLYATPAATRSVHDSRYPIVILPKSTRF
jgi:hypothetical protein